MSRVLLPDSDETLTEREVQVLRLMASGASNARIAELREGDYIGLLPGRAARLLAACEGGQILLSRVRHGFANAL